MSCFDLLLIELDDGKILTGKPDQFDGKNPWVSGEDFPQQTNPMIYGRRIMKISLVCWFPAGQIRQICPSGPGPLPFTVDGRGFFLIWETIGLANPDEEWNIIYIYISYPYGDPAVSS